MKAFASDFDGTLYFMSQEEKMRLCDLQAIREFQEKGNLFGVSTGRSLRGITDVVQEISFDFYILASGAYVLDRDFQVIFKKCIPFDTMKIIYERYEKDVLIIIQANDSVYAMQAKRPLQVYIESLEEMKGSDIYGLSFGTRSPEEARAIAEELNQCYGDTIIAYANVQNVDIVGKDCSKGRALSLVKEYYGVDIMAGIGDSYNDIPMLMESDQDTYRFPVLQGIWFHCDRKHELDAPLYIRENGTEEKARFKNVLADQSWGQDAFSHKILTGKASFDEQYAVYCEDEEGALKVLDGEMLRTIEEIRRNSEGKIQIEFQKDFTNIAIQTPFLIYSHLIGQKTGNVREIKQGFLVNLHYQFHLMQEIKRL